MNLDDLKRPFRPHEIDWRVGSTTKDKTKGMALAYMDARAVMERLDEVCGPENWQCRYPHAGQKTCCEIGIHIEWKDEEGDLRTRVVWKSDGAGDTDFEGDKGAFSDAFKCAAFRWGIGRYLYNIKTPWVPIDDRKRFTEEALTILNKAYREAIWRGPLGVVALKDTLKAFISHLNAAQSADDIDALIHANQAALDQCEYDEPNWFYGHGDVPSIDERITGKREELQEREAA